MTTSQKTLAGVCVLLSACSTLWASAADWTAPESAAQQKNPVAADAKSLARGKELYVEECADCHGEKGRGDGQAAASLPKRPADLAQKTRQSDGALFWKITEGKKPMPRFAKRLTDEDRWNLVNYIRTFVPQGSTGTRQGEKT